MIERKLTDVKAFMKYRYLMKHVGIELWFYNKKRSILLIFDDTSTQEHVFDYLMTHCSKVHTYVNGDIEQITKQWANHAISNFEYLMYVNAIASRSFNDISAYPVMPWLIADYKNTSFELDNPEFFRDLSKPIGAINKHRL